MKTSPIVLGAIVLLSITLFFVSLSKTTFLTTLLSNTLLSVLKLAETVCVLSTSSLYKLAKSYFTASLDVSTPVNLFKSAFFAQIV